MYELEAHVERLPLKTGNEQLFLYLQKLKSLTVDLNDKLLTYHAVMSELKLIYYLLWNKLKRKTSLLNLKEKKALRTLGVSKAFNMSRFNVSSESL